MLGPALWITFLLACSTAEELKPFNETNIPEGFFPSPKEFGKELPQLNNTVEANLTKPDSTAIHSNNTIGRMISSSENVQETPAITTNPATMPFTIILIAVAVIAAIVAVILSALFVMRRRFNVWRLGGENRTEDGEGHGVLKNASSTENTSNGPNGDQVEDVNEQQNESIKVVENKDADMGETNPAAEEPAADSAESNAKPQLNE